LFVVVGRRAPCGVCCDVWRVVHGQQQSNNQASHFLSASNRSRPKHSPGSPRNKSNAKLECSSKAFDQQEMVTPLQREQR
jgi:hypothetical protein